MERTNIYLSDRELAGLRLVSGRTGKPVAALVREAVDAWLDANGVREVPPDEWQRRFSELLARRDASAASLGLTQDVVDNEVKAAIAEVRSTRAARRR